MSVQALGPPIKGPTALGDDPRRLWNLARTMAVSEFKLRYFGSSLGYLWSLMKPLMLFGILYAVFTQIVRIGSGVELYPVALLLGVVLFGFLSESTGAALTSLVDREALIRKVEFPRIAVPFSTVLTALMNVGLNLIAVVVFLLAAGGSVRWSWLELPFLLAALAVLAGGAGMLLSVLYVRFRDVRPIWDVALQVLFYASPIFYPIDTVAKKHETLAHVLMLNPFAAILQQARHAVIAPSHPSAAAAIGGGAAILAPIAIGLAIAVAGFAAFHRAAPRIAEEL
jgi:ABC-2 type transport system permease protein